jgi:hypothetical protein
MISEADFAQLQKDVAEMKDRQAILDCIMRHSRGHDRHDSPVMASTYHADGIDEHGPNVIRGPVYGEWANPTHESFTHAHMHNITTHNCEIDGDVAHAESYVIVCLGMKDDQSTTFACGRYLDRLEKRNGEWRIALRRCVNEMTLTGDGSWINSPGAKGYLKGQWDKSDRSYQRPLQINEDDIRW